MVRRRRDKGIDAHMMDSWRLGILAFARAGFTVGQSHVTGAGNGDRSQILIPRAPARRRPGWPA